MKLSGGVALVTGGAHRIGRGISLALAHAGMHVAVHYGTSEDEARATDGEIAVMGVDAYPVQADLGDPAQIEALMGAVRERFGRLDMLVNSAASFHKQAFDEISVEDWDSVMAVNLRAPFLLTQIAARLMRSANRESSALIVNIADLSGLQPWTGYAHHSVSKAGLVHLTQIAARELAPDIRVNAIVPGAILPPPGVEADSPRWQEIVQRVPMKRSGGPDDLGRAIVFLGENDAISGAVLRVDGGEGLTQKPR
jgi:pteridine reductase